MAHVIPVDLALLSMSTNASIVTTEATPNVTASQQLGKQRRVLDQTSGLFRKQALTGCNNVKLVTRTILSVTMQVVAAELWPAV
jgi:hypothetical protein